MAVTAYEAATTTNNNQQTQDWGDEEGGGTLSFCRMKRLINHLTSYLLKTMRLLFS
jgi:hypothetical protein